MAGKPKQRIVIKLGSNVVIGSDGRFASTRLARLLRPLVQQIRSGYEIIIVSSGAVALGRGHIGHKKKDLTNAERQALAALGQSRLIFHYERIFAKEKQKVSQILLTREDLSHRQTYNNLRHTLDQLLEWKALPVLNENDSVSILELTETVGGFGDNDKLSALVAVKMNADLLILLSDVDGVYDKNPRQYKDAKLIKQFLNDSEITDVETAGKSNAGRGGMALKLQAARVASWSGVPVIIANGTKGASLKTIFAELNQGQNPTVGTYFLPRKVLQKKKHWIGFSSGVYGQIRVNTGAAKALIEGKKSLLPVGVIEITGDFERMQVVSICDDLQREIGRGISFFSSDELQKIKGLQSKEALKLIQDPEDDVVVQRDNFVALVEDQG